MIIKTTDPSRARKEAVNVMCCGITIKSNVQSSKIEDIK